MIRYIHKFSAILFISLVLILSAQSAQARDCEKSYWEKALQSQDRHERTFDDYPTAPWTILYWEFYGLEAALDKTFFITSSLERCLKRADCGLENIIHDKDTLKSLEKLNKAKIKNKSKTFAKHKALLMQTLPDRPPVQALIYVEDEIGQCGFSDEMKQRVRDHRLDTASPDILAREARCKTAYDNLYAIKGTNPDIVSMKDTLWGHRYLSAQREGRFCEEPSESLLNNAFASVDPYASMPLDIDRPEHFRQFSAALDFSAEKPLQSECEASLQGGTMMFEISPLAKPKPDEAAWMSHYNSVREVGGICNPIPTRLAEWGEDWVWQNGWPFAHDAGTAKLDTCMEAVRVVANDELGGEFARWVQGYNMRMLYPETRKPHGEICAGIPKPLQADLFPRMEAAREIRHAEAAERQRQFELDQANAPPPPSFGEIVREWSREWQNRPVLVERCYTNQYGRYVCYDTLYD